MLIGDDLATANRWLWCSEEFSERIGYLLVSWMSCKTSGHHLRMGSTRLSYFFPFTVFLESFLLLTFPYRKRGKESLSKSVKPNKEDSMATVFYSKSNTGKAAKPLSCDLIRKSDHKCSRCSFLRVVVRRYVEALVSASFHKWQMHLKIHAMKMLFTVKWSRLDASYEHKLIHFLVLTKFFFL